MGKLRYLLLIGCFLICCPLLSLADDQTAGDRVTYFQIGIAVPIQLFPEDYSVNGLRLGLIQVVNENVQGIDIGIVNETNSGVNGIELGAYNEVDRDFRGIQVGLIANETKRSCDGVQAALFYNNAEEEMHGLQLGIVNHTGSLAGVQIGLFNFNDDTRYLGFFPFINAAF